MRIQDLSRPSNGGSLDVTPNSPTENLYKMCGKVRRIFMLILAMGLNELILNPKKAINLFLNVYTSHCTHLWTLMWCRLKTLSVIGVVCFIVHDEFVVDEVKAIWLCLKWVINHFLYCKKRKKKHHLLNAQIILSN